MRTLRERYERLGMTAATVAKAAKVSIHYVRAGERAPPYARKAVRQMIAARELQERCLRQQAAKIARQREVWTSISGTGRARLVELMGNVAWELLNRGRLDEVDLVLEIMPKADAQRLLDEYFDDTAAAQVASEP